MSTILIINEDDYDFDLYLKNGLLNFKLDELQYLKIKRIFKKKRKININFNNFNNIRCTIDK